MRPEYPQNWRQLSLSVRQANNWTCVRCGTQCLKPGEGKNLSIAERRRLTLQAHHCDLNPSNGDIENLQALCAPCHLDVHRNQVPIAPGQLRLPFPQI